MNPLQKFEYTVYVVGEKTHGIHGKLETHYRKLVASDFQRLVHKVKISQNYGSAVATVYRPRNL